MLWTTVAWCASWVVAGVAVAAFLRPLGYHGRTWIVLGAVIGPLVAPVWLARRSRRHPGPELVEAGWSPGGDVDLLVVPSRGPTPALVRALAELRHATRRVAIARILPFDAPRRELADARLHLVADRDALGLPSADLVLLFGAPDRAVQTYAESAGVGLVLVDVDTGLRGRVATLRVVTPEDVPAAERRDSVRVLTSTRAVARVVRLPGAAGRSTACRGRAPGGAGSQSSN